MQHTQDPLILYLIILTPQTKIIKMVELNKCEEKVTNTKFYRSVLWIFISTSFLKLKYMKTGRSRCIYVYFYTFLFSFCYTLLKYLSIVSFPPFDCTQHTYKIQPNVNVFVHWELFIYLKSWCTHASSLAVFSYFVMLRC